MSSPQTSGLLFAATDSRIACLEKASYALQSHLGRCYLGDTQCKIAADNHNLSTRHNHCPLRADPLALRCV